jgi:ABC-2 type transport system ATP-binding protein
MTHILEVKNVSKSYGHNIALDHVSMNVPAGSIYGLLGPNGAGKTTLIRIINKIIGPDTGSINLMGQPIQDSNITNIGYLPEERGLYPKMKVGEQLIYLAQLKGLSAFEAREEIRKWFIEFDINGWWEKKVEELSKGMAQKLQFITTVIHKPNLIILDEPFSGFDPVNTELVKQKIFELKAQGATIMLSTHRMENVEELCENITLIDQAQNVLEGDIDTIKQQYRANAFEISLGGSIDQQNLELPFNYDIKWSKYNATLDHTRFRIQIPEHDTPNKLLQHLMVSHTVYSLKEILPSIHDIFVATVTEDETKPAKSNS